MGKRNRSDSAPADAKSRDIARRPVDQSAGGDQAGQAGTAATQPGERVAGPARKDTDGVRRPPGRVLSGRHGPQQRIAVLTAVGRLRKVLNLSPVCDIQQVCSDAASEIERLRNAESERAARWYKRE